MTVLEDYLKYHLPSKETAKAYIHIVIRNYSQLEEYKFYKQMDITTRCLYVAGFNRYYSINLVGECLEEAGYSNTTWLDWRTFDEIVKPKGVIA